MLLTSKTYSPLMRLRHFRNPVLLSCECKGTTTFPIHQMFGKLFFRRRLLIMILWRWERPALTCDGLDLLRPETIYPQMGEISTWKFANLHVEKENSPRGREMKLRRNQMKLRRKCFAPTWRIKNSHRGNWIFLGDYSVIT